MLLWPLCEWDVGRLYQLLPTDIVNKIRALPAPSSDDGRDRNFCLGTIDWEFSANTAYTAYWDRFGLPYRPHKKCWKDIWSLDGPQRYKLLPWRIAHDKLQTNVRHSGWYHCSSDCFHCVGIPETTLNVFRDCPVAIQIWIPLCLEEFF